MRGQLRVCSVIHMLELQHIQNSGWCLLPSLCDQHHQTVDAFSHKGSCQHQVVSRMHHFHGDPSGRTCTHAWAAASVMVLHWLKLQDIQDTGWRLLPSLCDQHHQQQEMGLITQGWLQPQASVLASSVLSAKQFQHMLTAVVAAADLAAELPCRHSAVGAACSLPKSVRANSFLPLWHVSTHSAVQAASCQSWRWLCRIHPLHNPALHNLVHA
jgi:hypothetical protein